MPHRLYVSKIEVIDRHRSDLGDLTDLRESIDKHGLLHPVVVTDELRLVSGERRLRACEQLGWKEVPVTYVSGLRDATSLLQMERDENTCRKEMTVSEKVALGLALEELERPKAKGRMAEGGRGGRVDLQIQPSMHTPVRVREVVGSALGIAGSQYDKAKRVYLAAEQGDEAAKEARKKMDRTNSIVGAYDEWNTGVPATEPRPTGRPLVKSMERVTSTLSGISMGLRRARVEDFAEVPAEDRKRWADELTATLKELRRVRDLLKGPRQ